MQTRHKFCRASGSRVVRSTGRPRRPELLAYPTVLAGVRVASRRATPYRNFVRHSLFMVSAPETIDANRSVPAAKLAGEPSVMTPPARVGFEHLKAATVNGPRHTRI